jgi:hypothetical protein
MSLVTARSPNLNAYTERFVGSIKSECPRHIVPIGERHLRAVCGNASSTITTSAITKASITLSRCHSGNQTRERSDATYASAAYWATIGGRPHNASDRVFGQRGGAGMSLRTWCRSAGAGGRSA